MLPDCDLSSLVRRQRGGNGRAIALLDREARAEIERVVRDVEKIETAVEPKFQEHFVAAMAIPHKTDRYETLPRRRAHAGADGGKHGPGGRGAAVAGAAEGSTWLGIFSKCHAHNLQLGIVSWSYPCN